MSAMLQVAGFAGDSIVDGPGLRFTVFFQGCPHHCPGCHNPETWPFEGGTPFTPEQLIQMAKKNPLCRGITLSGGEPFAQAGPEMLEFVRLARAAGYEVASSAGYTFEELYEHGTPAQKELLTLLDTLIDGPFVQAEMSWSCAFGAAATSAFWIFPKALPRARPCGRPANAGWASTNNRTCFKQGPRTPDISGGAGALFAVLIQLLADSVTLCMQ